MSLTKSKTEDKLKKREDPSSQYLFKLARDGLLDKIEKKLRNDEELPDGLRLDSRVPGFEWTLLHYAANGGATGLLEWLLQKKAKMETTDSEGNTPLILAARQNHVETMELLIGRNADLEARTKRELFTPLIWAASAGQEAAAESLLQAAASLAATDAQGRTAFMWAARHGHFHVVQLLLRRGPDLTQRDSDGLTALDHTRQQLELRAAVVFAQEHATRLLTAAQRNDFSVVKEVLKTRAYPRYKDASGWSPLTWAVLHDSAELARLLVRHGAAPEILGEDAELGEQIARSSRTMGEKLAEVLGANDRLLSAASAGNPEEVQAALEAGACPDVAQGRDGGGGGQGERPAFFDAAMREEEIMNGAEAAAELFCEPTGEGAGRHMTAPMWSARLGHAEIVKMLGSSSADMNRRDARGWTAMLFAMISCDPLTISMLHYFNADITQRGYEGESALHLAVRMNSPVAVQLLLAAEANIDEKDLAGRAPLHVAAHYGSTAALKALLWYGADFKSKDKRGRTPCIVAACSGNADLIEEMMSSEIEPPAALPVEIPEDEESELEPLSENGEEEEIDDDETVSATQPNSRRGSSPRESGQNEVQGSEGNAQRPGSGKRANERRKMTKKTFDDVPIFVETVAEGAETDEDEAAEEDESEEEIEEEVVEEVIKPVGEELLVAAEKRRRELIAESETSLPGLVLLQDVDSKGRSPLHHCVTAGREICHFHVLSRLLELKADTNWADKDGKTPLMVAAAAGYAQAVEKMLKLADTDPSIQDKKGKSAVDFAKKPDLKKTLERAVVARKTGRTGSSSFSEPSGPPQEASPDEPVLFRVRLEKLPIRMTPEALEQKIALLSKKVVVRPVRTQVVLDPIMGRPKGHAYLDFRDSRSATKAMDMDGMDVAGSRILAFRDLPAAMVG
eukprot:TRINITY_DN11109_c0_g2_i1.p1 TRINITY_DN11109_c0_g2~~TRINITY_DN11109_c0_g2_i1.p1  ORF type:complete len:910 (-),score=215.15 TRINITY_DN11109_c0_g2_i1:1082-3811(-)